jgi:hypothetical protein
LLATEKKNRATPDIQGNPVSFSFPRQPGYLIETRGFPSPSHEGFGFFEEYILYVIITK